jgi:hypothetical protein
VLVPISPIQQLPTVGEFLTEGNTLATNKASGLTAWNTSRKADLLNKKGNEAFYEEWCLRHEDMVSRGESPARYHKFYEADPKRITDYKLKSFENTLGAITRAVRKYGSYESAKQAFLKDTRYEYVTIGAFIAWAPAGQRAKSDSKPAPAVAITITASEARKRLAKYSPAVRDEIIKALGLK